MSSGRLHICSMGTSNGLSVRTLELWPTGVAIPAAAALYPGLYLT